MALYVVAAAVDAGERKYAERVRLRGLRDASNPFALSETKFKKLFRLPIHAAHHLCEVLDAYPKFYDCDNIPIHLKILGTLQFYADGGYQTPDGSDSLIGLSQPSMSRAIDQTTDAIVDILGPVYIQFPITPEEKENTMREFQELYGLPHVLGAVDGTHIGITKPPQNDPYAPGVIFYNRKGYYSLNCQVVTNAKGRILSVNPNFPGSTHDSAVWRSSGLARHLETEFVQGMDDQWLLGDKGYPLLPWLMTPVSAPETEAEECFNAAHSATRNIVEMTFGRLKNKMRCLHKHRTLHYSPAKAARIIVACCTLYNMFVDVLSDTESDNDDEDDDNQDDSIEGPGVNDENLDYLSMARAKRNTLINRFR